MKMMVDSATRTLGFVAVGWALVMFLFSGTCLAGATMNVQGTVVTSQGKPVANITVVLLKIIMQKKPSITPLMQNRTDQEGRYQFSIEPMEGNIFFRLHAKSDTSETGSEPFRLQVGQPVKMVQLVLPETLIGVKHLDFRKHILIVEALEEALQITEVINFSNRSGGMVNVDRSHFARRIPADAVNFQFFKRQNRFQATREQDRILFQLQVPPGEHQLVYSYDLPVGSRAISFLADLPPRLGELELIVPVNTLDLSFDNSGDLSSARIVKQEKQFSNKLYNSQTLSLDSDQRDIAVLIKNIPISQARFYYPAALLAAILLLGLYIFLIRKPQASRGTENQ